MDNLGQKIKDKRLQKNMTIEELSKKTYLSIAVIKDLEAGKFDQYQGDETYVKMYLKKISDVLDLDSFELTQSYYALTQEIKMSQFKEQEDLEKKKQEVVKKGKSFTFDLPQFARKKSVYENRSHEKVIRVIIVVALISLIFITLWWGISQTKSNVDNPSFDSQNQTTIEGDISLDNDHNNQDDVNNNSNDLNNNQNDLNNNQNITLEDVKMSRNAKLDFNIQLPLNVDKISFKMVFGSESWSSLKLNGKDYKNFIAKIYKPGDIVELTFTTDEFIGFDLKNGYGMGHKYYINNVEIPLLEEDYSEGVTHLKLNLEKQNDITE